MMNPLEHESVIKLLSANQLWNKMISVMEKYIQGWWLYEAGISYGALQVFKMSNNVYLPIYF